MNHSVLNYVNKDALYRLVVTLPYTLKVGLYAKNFNPGKTKRVMLLPYMQKTKPHTRENRYIYTHHVLSCGKRVFYVYARAIISHGQQANAISNGLLCNEHRFCASVESESEPLMTVCANSNDDSQLRFWRVNFWFCNENVKHFKMPNRAKKKILKFETSWCCNGKTDASNCFCRYLMTIKLTKHPQFVWNFFFFIKNFIKTEKTTYKKSLLFA